MKKILSTAVIVVASAGSALAGTVTSIDASYVADGRWFKSDVRPGGTASIADLSGLGGNLENSAPLPTGAARLTTDSTDAAKAEISVRDSYGLVSDIISSIAVGYDYHKAFVSGGNAFAAPSIKLTFYNAAYVGDGFVTLIYEPSWNQPGFGGSSVAVPTDTWTHIAIDKDNGLFWQNGGFGQANSAGGPPLKTLADWDAAFDSGFDGASLIAISVGVGTYNRGQNGYFDNVTYSADGYSVAYDFQVVPLPPAAWSGLVLLGGLGLFLRGRRRSEI